jgi:hypothetical protein
VADGDLVQRGITAAIELYFVELGVGQQALKVSDEDVLDLFAF